MKFLVDNQLPAALARLLTSRGTECDHVLDLDMADASDADICKYASRNDPIVISKDEDFYILRMPPHRLCGLYGFVLGIAARRHSWLQ